MSAFADRPSQESAMPSANGQGPRYRLDLMRQEDVNEVAQVERRCFTNPWPMSAYRRELQHPDQNYYIVLRDLRPPVAAEPVDAAPAPAAPRPLPRRTLLPMAFGRRPEPDERSAEPIVGFAGMWNAFDEAHVTTIAVDEPYRGRGLGELLLVALFDEAMRRGANWLTLEVRVSNDSAQSLYRKWGFSVQGSRRRYYSDNNEDAHIMWSRPLSDADYRADLARLRGQLLDRLDGQVADLPPSPPPVEPRRRAGRAPWEPGKG